MEMYSYAYPSPFPPNQPSGAEYPDHGDGYGDYYNESRSDEKRKLDKRAGRSARRTSKRRVNRSRSLSATKTTSRSRSRSRSKSRPGSKSHSKSRSGSRSGRCSRGSTRSRSRSGSKRDLRYREPGFLDAFRVLYLTPNKQKQNTAKQQEILKSDGLGSKKWLFYPRPHKQTLQSESSELTERRHNSDQRVKIDAEFFRKYKRRSKVDSDVPIAKLKRWELILYKKLGFLQAV
ncbi:hypothetical protein ACJJTC_003528 [Scirpophaga incertulas]